jgi:hypothetical protein
VATTCARQSLRRPHLAVALAVVVVLLAVGLLADPAGSPRRPAATRPDLQRIIDRLVTGRDRIAPGVTAYVAGPHGTWTGSAGVADVATGEPMRPTARLRRPGNDYRLGTAVDESFCAGPVYAHNGGGLGFESNVFVSGDGRRVAVVLLNGRTQGGEGDARAAEAMRGLYCAA